MYACTFYLHMYTCNLSEADREIMVNQMQTCRDHLLNKKLHYAHLFINTFCGAWRHLCALLASAQEHLCNGITVNKNYIIAFLINA